MHVAQPIRNFGGRSFAARAGMFLVVAVLVIAAAAVLVMSVFATPRPIPSAPDAGGSSAGSSRPAFVQPHVEGVTGP